jgi:hypothetical protein
MSITGEPSGWADYIMETGVYERRSHVEEMKRAGFDVGAQAERMMAFYETGEWK